MSRGNSSSSREVEASRPQLAKSAPNRFATRGWWRRQRLANAVVDNVCLVRYKRAGSEAQGGHEGRKSESSKLGNWAVSRNPVTTCRLQRLERGTFFGGCRGGLARRGGAQGSNQPITITLRQGGVRRACEAGAPAVKRGTTRPTRSGQPSVARPWVDPIKGALGSWALWAVTGVQRERLWHGGFRFRALSGAMKRLSMSVETSTKNHRATESVRICVRWRLPRSQGRRVTSSVYHFRCDLLPRTKLSQLKTALFWFGFSGAKPLFPAESRRSIVMPWPAARRSWRCASAE